MYIPNFKLVDFDHFSTQPLCPFDGYIFQHNKSANKSLTDLINQALQITAEHICIEVHTADKDSSYLTALLLAAKQTQTDLILYIPDSKCLFGFRSAVVHNNPRR